MDSYTIHYKILMRTTKRRQSACINGDGSAQH